MTLYEFKLLTEDEQTECIWASGDFVADRQENDCSILLYQLFGFYVEVKYVGKANNFQILRSFCSTNQLMPYLNEIDITSLLML